MNRVSLRLAAAAVLALTGAPADAFDNGPARPVSPGQSVNDRLPFPMLMNALFGRERATAIPEPRFGRPQNRYYQPVSRVERAWPGAEPARPRPRVEPGVAALQPAPQPQPRQMDPKYERRIVDYSGGEKPGTIVIDTGQRFLYLVQDGGTAIRYGVGVGREGFSWSGTEKISRKADWPDWRPPAEMKKRQPGLPDHMPGGPNNPLGARALYLGSTLYRIHGSNEPWTIGRAVSSGCIRMRNEDVIDLYDRVGIGTTVKVI